MCLCLGLAECMRLDRVTHVVANSHMKVRNLLRDDGFNFRFERAMRYVI
jgi:hypothetical protein